MKNSWELSPLPPHNFHFLLSRTRQGPSLDKPSEIPTSLRGNPVKSDLSSSTRKPSLFCKFCFKIPFLLGPECRVIPHFYLPALFISLPFSRHWIRRGTSQRRGNFPPFLVANSLGCIWAFCGFKGTAWAPQGSGLAKETWNIPRFLRAEGFLKGYIVEKENLETLQKPGASLDAPAKKGQKRGRERQNSPLEANSTQQKEKHLMSCKAKVVKSFPDPFPRSMGIILPLFPGTAFQRHPVLSLGASKPPFHGNISISPSLSQGPFSTNPETLGLNLWREYLKFGNIPNSPCWGLGASRQVLSVGLWAGREIQRSFPNIQSKGYFCHLVGERNRIK